MEILEMAFEPQGRKYVPQVPLNETADAHALQEDLTQFLKRVARLMATLFQTTHLAVLVNDRGLYRPVEVLGYAVTPAVSFSEESDILKQLQREAGPASVCFDDCESSRWVWRLPDHERDLLEDLCADILAPIRVNGRLLAVVSLGRKKSGELYSRIELKLLQMLGAEELQDRISA
jgi:transcriptional regulator with GAF, ATPase, and Fis domain